MMVYGKVGRTMDFHITGGEMASMVTREMKRRGIDIPDGFQMDCCGSGDRLRVRLEWVEESKGRDVFEEGDDEKV